jgi:hypothetical protein
VGLPADQRAVADLAAGIHARKPTVDGAGSDDGRNRVLSINRLDIEPELAIRFCRTVLRSMLEWLPTATPVPPFQRTSRCVTASGSIPSLVLKAHIGKPVPAAKAPTDRDRRAQAKIKMKKR